MCLLLILKWLAMLCRQIEDVSQTSAEVWLMSSVEICSLRRFITSCKFSFKAISLVEIGLITRRKMGMYWGCNVLLHWMIRYCEKWSVTKIILIRQIQKLLWWRWICDDIVIHILYVPIKGVIPLYHCWHRREHWTCSVLNRRTERMAGVFSKLDAGNSRLLQD